MNERPYSPIAKAGGPDWDRLWALAARLEPRLRQAFLESVKTILDRLPLSRIIEALESGTWERLVEGATAGGAVFSPIRAGILVGIGTVAKEGQAGVKGFVGTVDMHHPLAVKLVEESSLPLIREMTQSAREGVRDAVMRGLQNGWNPRKTAQEIRTISTFGLTSSQRQAVENFRRLVESGDREALTRQLRDKRYDPSLRAQILGERNLTREQIDSMVEAYERRYLRYRAETIARTESIRALSRGNRLLWAQWLEQQPDSSSIELRRYWYVAPGERTCPICRPIPRMNPKGRGFTEPFDTPAGPVMDTPLHSSCRCTILTRPQ